MTWTTGYFKLSGEFDPDEITNRFGIQPSWVKRIGDPGQSDALTARKGSEWCLTCDKPDVVDVAEQTIDVDDQIIALLSKLRPRKEIVADLSGKFNGTFHIHLLLSIRHRGFFVSPEIIKEISALNVSIQCTYFEAA